MTKIILFGDSITAGYENGVTDFRVNEGIEKEFSDVEVINAGIPGNTTKEAVLRVNDHVTKYQPDFVVVFFGANDASVLNDVSLSEYKANLSYLIHQIGREKVILIGGPFARQETYLNLGRHIDELKKYSEGARTVANEHDVPFVNLLEEMLKSSSPKALLQDDGLHLSKSGYQLLISLINQEIKSKMEGK